MVESRLSWILGRGGCNDTAMPIFLLRSLLREVITDLSRPASRAGEPTRELTMRYLIVVARNEPALYEHLRGRHESDPGVRVVVDRRGARDGRSTDSPPPVERRRRRSWLATGASHELVQVAREDTTTVSPSPKQQPSVHYEEARRPMSEMEILESPQQVTRWLAESQHILGRVIPALIEDRDRLRQTLEAREREREGLHGEVSELRRNLGSLQGELERLRGERVAMAETVGGVVGLLGQLQQPLDELGRRLHAAQPGSVDT